MTRVLTLLKKNYAWLIFLHGLVFASKAFAQNSPVEEGLGKIKQPFGNATRFSDNKNIYQIIASVIKIMLQLGFAIAVIMVIVGGYMYITARGNEEQAGTARKTIVYALIGVVIIIMSYVLVSIVINAAIDPDSLTV